MDGFRSRDALAEGVTRWELYSGQFAAPFHGMRSHRAPKDHLELCRAAMVVLPERAAVSHRSAAVLHGFPLPAGAAPDQVDISVFEPHRSPRLSGVRPHQLTPTGQRVVTVDGLRLLSPEDTWVHLGALLGRDDLVAAGDYAITGSEPYDGTKPPTTRSRLDAALHRHGRHRGVRNLRAAAEQIRYGSLSPRESRLRLALEDAGLPSPELNYRVAGPTGRTAAMIDLAYPASRVAVEYLGDHHRATSAAYRKDIARREWLVDHGWDVVFVTAADSLPAVATRVRSALRRSLTR
jgi:very-short-patch-repair endonuclease